MVPDFESNGAVWASIAEITTAPATVFRGRDTSQIFATFDRNLKGEADTPSSVSVWLNYGHSFESSLWLGARNVEDYLLPLQHPAVSKFDKKVVQKVTARLVASTVGEIFLGCSARPIIALSNTCMHRRVHDVASEVVAYWNELTASIPRKFVA